MSLDADAVRYARVIAAVCSVPWAITPEILAVIQDLLAYRAGGGRLTKDEIRARIAGDGRAAASGARAGQARAGGVAVIPITGVIAHRMSYFEDTSSSGTAVELLHRRLREALANPSVGSIVLDVDSPGGAVDGVPEIAAEIFAARGDKPITAVADTLAASAAYWIASAADELVVSPSGEVGSIGVFAAHVDISEAEKLLGRKTTLISAGKYKVEGHPFEPLSDDARAAIQDRVDAYYDDFVKAVARGRGVKASAVRSGFGEGRVVGASEAVALGMADRVGTLDETVARMAGGRKPRSGRRATQHRRRLAFI